MSDSQGPLRDMPPEETVSAAQEPIAYGNAAAFGDEVVSGLPGEPVGPLTTTTLAEGSAAGVPAEAIGFFDQAGIWVSSLIAASPASALVLAGLVAISIGLAVSAVIDRGRTENLNAKQAEALAEQARNPTSDPLSRPLGDASQVPVNPTSNGDESSTTPQPEVIDKAAAGERRAPTVSREQGCAAEAPIGDATNSGSAVAGRGSDLEGTWSVKDPGCDICSDTFIITTTCPGHFLLTIGSHASGNGCTSPYDVNQNGPNTYIATRPHEQDCYGEHLSLRLEGNSLVITEPGYDTREIGTRVTAP
jgi:hypothetical protein